MNRRDFMTSLAATGAFAATSSGNLFAAQGEEPTKVGLIGCGWFGNVDLDLVRLNRNIDVRSLCDVNSKHLTETVNKISALQTHKPKGYADYRDMLKGEKLDVVIIATPDHWHALIAIEAMKAGADLLLEKPISIDVIEGEAILAAARKYKRVVQVNTQRRSSPIQIAAKAKYIDSGRLGRIGVVEAYFYGGQSDKVLETQTPPGHLDYEMWAGPAPKVDYVSDIESKGWRRFKEYANGYSGDMGVHMFDMVRMMLGLKWPESISSSGGMYVNKNATGYRPDTQHSVFNYPDLRVSWEHRMWGESPIPKRHWTDQWGARFIGTKGTLNVNLFGYEFQPKNGAPKEGFHQLSTTKNLENLVFDDWRAEFDKLSMHHKDDLFASIKERSRPNADVEEGHISSACCILANLSLDLGRSVKYDPKTRTVIGDPEATQKLSRPYRGNWKHPDPKTV